MAAEICRRFRVSNIYKGGRQREKEGSDEKRPWYQRMLDIMNGEADSFLNRVRVIQISLFIVVIALLILSYFILWKSYEERLVLLLEKSYDLIKLIPEEIKYIIVSKLNE